MNPTISPSEVVSLPLKVTVFPTVVGFGVILSMLAVKTVGGLSCTVHIEGTLTTGGNNALGLVMGLFQVTMTFQLPI